MDARVKPGHDAFVVRYRGKFLETLILKLSVVLAIPYRVFTDVPA